MTTQTKYGKYEGESDYYAMGYRMYSAEFGRFLAVDPLFEAMPRHNPYHYSYNSPMFWSDPSGLAPVKEKVKNSEQLLAVQFDWKKIQEFYIDHQEETNSYESRWFSWGRYDMQTIYNLDPIKFMFGGGASSTSAPRVGAWWTIGSSPYQIGLGSFGDLKNPSFDFNYYVHIQTLNGLVSMKVNIHDDPTAPRTDFYYLDKLVEGINTILDADPHYFDPLVGGKYEIYIASDKDIAFIYNIDNGKDADYLTGLAKRNYPEDGISSIFIASEVFQDGGSDNHYYYWNNWSGANFLEKFKVWEVLAHEFGHIVDYLQKPWMWTATTSDFIENSTIQKVNVLRSKLGLDLEILQGGK